MNQWFVLQNNQPVGPLDHESMRSRIASGEFNATTLVCRVGATSWSPLGQDAMLAGPSAPPPPYGSPAPPPPLGTTPWNVHGTAKNHRIMMYCLLAMLVLTFVMLFAGYNNSILLLNVMAVLYLIAAIMTVVFTCITMAAMRVHVGLIILCAVFLLVPCASLITLIVLSQIIQAKLRSVGLKVGLKVGFLGVSPKALEAAGFRP